MSRYQLVRGQSSAAYRLSGKPEHHTDNLIEAVLMREFLRMQEPSPMNEGGPWNVLDNSTSPRRFVGEQEPPPF